MSRNQTDIDEAAKGKSARFDVTAIAASFPPTASTLLIDHYLTNRQAASARVFRVYKSTPPHYHATCDEYLFVLSGRGTFWMEDASTKAQFVAGTYCSSSAARCMRCLTFLRSRWCSSRSIRRGASPPISSSSIPKTARPRPLWPATLRREPRSPRRDMSVPPHQLRQPKIDYVPWLGFQSERRRGDELDRSLAMSDMLRLAKVGRDFARPSAENPIRPRASSPDRRNGRPRSHGRGTAGSRAIPRT
jgi:hypothetical protein